jgi:hypothetical protein
LKASKALILGVIVLVAASISVYEIDQSYQPRWWIDYASASSTTHSPIRNGLELTATIKEVFLPEGQNLTVVAEVNNTLATPLTVNATSMVNPAYGPCQQGFATGIEVYSGNLTYMELFNNGSAAKPLLLYNPLQTTLCPAVFSWQYRFQSQSAVASVQGTLGRYHTRNETKLIEETSIVAGYWVGDQFQRFALGQYTVVVFDVWGDRAIGHFQVVP